jgi:ribose 5-phosphate isomerase B
MNDKIIALASDHAGVAHKQALLRYLADMNRQIVDVGAYSEESVDYPQYAHALALLVAAGGAAIGCALCGTGNGMAMTLNRHAGIRAGLAWNVEVACLIRQHNDANVCVMPARFVSMDQMLDIARAFLAAGFEGGRHLRRIEMIEHA